MLAERSVPSRNPVDALKPQWRSAFTLIEIIFVIAILGVLAALLLPATRRAREPARRTQCKNNLKQIGLALHNYHDTFGAFPPAYTVDADGKPLHSWRTLILPWLDQAPLFNKINLSKPWDDPANAEAFNMPMPVYSCPSDPSPRGQTSYLAVVTPNSAFGPTKSRSIKEITDGTANTLLVIEVPHGQGVHWMCPQDADEQILELFLPKSKESHTGGRHALLADGSVRFLSQNINRATFQALISAAAGDRVSDF